MKKIFIIVIFIIGAIFIFYISISTKTYFGRYIKWRASDIEDYRKFPKYAFQPSNNPFYFVKKDDKKLDSIKITQDKNEKALLKDILKNSGTTAFLIIKEDTIQFEKYLNGYHRESINTSFSVAKSITSLIIGKAIDEHLISSVNDPVIKYLPELLRSDTGYRKLLISHILDMRSGIQFKDHDLPWGDKPKAYYYPELRKRIMELPVEYEPGSKFEYNSYNPILAGMILEKVTDMSPAKYFEQKLWNEIGMEFSGSWSVDSEESGMTKMESGLNIRAIDFAKFGRLILNRGNWDGNQLISESWMDYSFKISKMYNLEELSNDLFYRNFWWIYARKENSEYSVDIISGTGHLGQYLFIFPKEKIIFVRMGKKNINVGSWRKIFQEIVNQKYTNSNN